MMRSNHEKYYDPEHDGRESAYAFEELYEETCDIDMGYLEDDLELYGEYDDDFNSVWHGC